MKKGKFLCRRGKNGSRDTMGLKGEREKSGWRSRTAGEKRVVLTNLGTNEGQKSERKRGKEFLLGREGVYNFKWLEQK